MRVMLNETFFSPQGEGYFSGVPTLFIRMYGCNLDCSWCDQPSALTTRGSSVSKSYEMDHEEIRDIIDGYPLSVPVCFTGGEPMQQHEAIYQIAEADQERQYTMETNGTIYVEKFASLENFFVSMSPKISGVFLNQAAQMHGQESVFSWLREFSNVTFGGSPFNEGTPCSQLKFVVGSEAEFLSILQWLKLLTDHSRLGKSYSSPVYFQAEYSKGREAFREIVKKYCTLEEYETHIAPLNLYGGVHFSTQAHKTLLVR